MIKTNNKGFSLLELLVVITIIGILAAVLTANFSGSREDAKNKSVQAELKGMQLSLELYKAQYGRYPDTPPAGFGCTVTALNVSSASSDTCGTFDYIVGLRPDFIADLLTDKGSANSSCNIVYKVDATSGTEGSWYKLTAENCHAGATSAADGINQTNEFARCPSVCTATGDCNPANSSFYESYAVYSAGGECR